MNITVALPENAADFLVSLIPTCLILAAFFAGVALAKKHFRNFLIGDLEDEGNN
jgi:hypothetical protein